MLCGIRLVQILLTICISLFGSSRTFSDHFDGIDIDEPVERWMKYVLDESSATRSLEELLAENREYLNETRNYDTPKYFTSFNGAKISNTINSLSVGPYGPLLMADNVLLEKLGHFVRERIINRVASALGNGAFGYFEVTNPDVDKDSIADLFSEPGKRTSIAVRFSLQAASPGESEVQRTAHSVAIKFYTKDGNWDLLMLNTPVFAIRDSIQVTELFHSFEPDPVNHLRNPNNMWDYLSLQPSSLLQVLFLKSDMGIPKNWRKMSAWSVDTYEFQDRDGNFAFVRFTLEPKIKVKGYLDDEEAARISGDDPNHFSRDLWQAIERGDDPTWLLKYQIIRKKQLDKIEFNPLDATKIWPVDKYPEIVIGKVVLDENPFNYFAEIEQLAFNPSNVVPGILTTFDKNLQGRLFAYRDAQNYRLGVNHEKLAVNKPIVKMVNPTFRDGFCADYENGGSEPNYFPNSLSGKIRDIPMNTTKSWLYPSHLIKRYDTTRDSNYWQVDMVWKTYKMDEKQRIAQRTADALADVDKFIQKRYVNEVGKANKEYSNMIQEALKLNEQKRLENISMDI
ncbi:vegetative catalase-like [Brevipalpus obovatus]|uniref:vegetative catalase-like n=1 Tax=Brevipalpus obovatus TaxID=246614 RepID=UPI003D9E7A1D